MANISNRNSEGIIYTRNFGVSDIDSNVVVKHADYPYTFPYNSEVNNARVIPQWLLDFSCPECPECPEPECPPVDNEGYPIYGQLYPRGNN